MVIAVFKFEIFLSCFKFTLLKWVDTCSFPTVVFAFTLNCCKKTFLFSKNLNKRFENWTILGKLGDGRAHRHASLPSATGSPRIGLKSCYWKILPEAIKKVISNLNFTVVFMFCSILWLVKYFHAFKWTLDSLHKFSMNSRFITLLFVKNSKFLVEAGHGRWQGGARDGHGPPGFLQNLSKTSQISKILSFLVVNHGFIRIGSPLLKTFLPMLMRLAVLEFHEFSASFASNLFLNFIED